MSYQHGGNGTRVRDCLTRLSMSSDLILLCDVDGILVDTKESTVGNYLKALHTIVSPLFTRDQVERAVWGRNWESAAEILCLCSSDAAAVHQLKSTLPLRYDVIEHNVLYVKSRLPHVAFLTCGSERASKRKMHRCRLHRGNVFFSCDKTNESWWRNAIPNVGSYDLLDDSVVVNHVARRQGVLQCTCG